MQQITTASGKSVFPVGVGTFGIASRENEQTAEALRYQGYKNVEPVYGNEEREIAGLQHSLQVGQNYVDTAGLYGAGYTNEVVGRALAGSGVPRSDLFIAHNVWKSDYGRVYDAVREHLGKLGISHFDVAGPHSPYTDGWSTPSWEATMEDFARLREEGLILGVSLSNFKPEAIAEAERRLGFRVTTAQAGYSVLDQDPRKQELRDYCEKNGIQLVGYQALSGGVLQNAAVREIAAAHNASAAQVGLSFVMGEGILPLAKALDPHHINDNAGAAELMLTPAEMDALRNQGPDSRIAA